MMRGDTRSDISCDISGDIIFDTCGDTSGIQVVIQINIDFRALRCFTGAFGSIAETIREAISSYGNLTLFLPFRYSIRFNHTYPILTPTPTPPALKQDRGERLSHICCKK